jgi:hypothetical protein
MHTYLKVIRPWDIQAEKLKFLILFKLQETR